MGTGPTVRWMFPAGTPLGSLACCAGEGSSACGLYVLQATMPFNRPTCLRKAHRSNRPSMASEPATSCRLLCRSIQFVTVLESGSNVWSPRSSSSACRHRQSLRNLVGIESGFLFHYFNNSALKGDKPLA